MPLGLSDRVLRCALSKTPVFVFYALLQFFYRKSFAGAIFLFIFASWVCLPFLRPLQNGFTLLLLLLGVATFMGIMSKERRDFDGRRIEKVITRRRRYKRSGSVTCPLDDNYRPVVYRGEGVDRGGHNRTTKNMTERLFEKVALVVGGETSLSPQL